MKRYPGGSDIGWNEVQWERQTVRIAYEEL